MPDRPTDNEEAKVKDLVDNLGKYLQDTLNDVFRQAGREFKKQLSEASQEAGKAFANQIQEAAQDAADNLEEASQKAASTTKARQRKPASASGLGLTEEEEATYSAKREAMSAKRKESERRSILKDIYDVGTSEEKAAKRKKESQEAKQAARDDKAIVAAKKSFEANANAAEKKARLQNAKELGDPTAIAAAKQESKEANKAAADARFQENIIATANNIGNKLDELKSNVAKAVDNEISRAIKSYSDYQGKIEARLQGVTSIQAKNFGLATTQFGRITQNLGQIAYSPLLSATDLYANLMDLINQGVVTNIEQRALLMTMKDDIISTFDVDSPVIKKLVRVQQEDSTAARMGMESYLNRFLNEFVDSTEYLTSTFDSVAASLYEASALLGSRDATEFEYIVQKWLGTLTGVGLNEATAQSIAQAIGELGSGNISNVGNGGINNLLVMAATKAGLPYADLLKSGLNATNTNLLLASLTDYLKELGLQSANNNVVKNQLAQTFGVKVSDLTAADNLTSTEIENVYKEVMSYTDMYHELQYQFDQINIATGRTSVGKIVNNAMQNYLYQTGMSVASNPALNALWQITDLIQNTTGGINLPFINAFGTGLDLNTTVENLMKLGIVGAGTLGQIGGLIKSVGSVFKGSLLLDAVSSGNTKVSRGSGIGEHTSGAVPRRASGMGTSASDYVGNEAGSDYADSALNKAKDSNQAELDRAKAENQPSDETAKYLSDMQFADQMALIREDVHALRTDGVKVSNFDYLREHDIIAGSLQGFFAPALGD